jgi:DNA mismatch repair ATPase MutS
MSGDEARRPAAADVTGPSLSILYPDDQEPHGAPQPFLADLDLDQLVDRLVAGRDAGVLKQVLRSPLQSMTEIHYRHAVMRDLSDAAVFGRASDFAHLLASVREGLRRVDRLHYQRQRERQLLDAIALYCDAVETIGRGLSDVSLRSVGLAAFRDHVNAYRQSPAFRKLSTGAETLLARLDQVRYTMLIKGNQITVDRFDSDPDYGAEVESAFEKFRQGESRVRGTTFPPWVEMSHVEARVLDLVAQLHPDVFSDLTSFCQQHRTCLDPTISRFGHEIHFYLSYIKFMLEVSGPGLDFCYPEVVEAVKDIDVSQTFDLVLAAKLRERDTPVVGNDFFLRDRERVIVVSGPSRSGKTTLARIFGQLHYLARLGYPVPGRHARLFLCDQIYTHFERVEDDRTGKLADDLDRIHDILEHATPNSIVILNEIFSSTSLTDAILLGRRVLARVIALGAICVYVTFIEELASTDAAVVSMTGAVDPDDPAERTYEIKRQPADAATHTTAVARRHRLTYGDVRQRLSP